MKSRLVVAGNDSPPGRICDPHRKVRKAVFPVGGLGTRFLPITKAVPMEMLPIVDRPPRRFALKRTLNGSIMLDLRAVEKAMSTSGKVTVERDGRTYAATYTVEGDMVHVKTHTETRSVALSGESPEDIARRELKEIVEASRRH